MSALYRTSRSGASKILPNSLSVVGTSQLRSACRGRTTASAIQTNVTAGAHPAASPDRIELNTNATIATPHTATEKAPVARSDSHIRKTLLFRCDSPIMSLKLTPILAKM
jgi:hypothetical protein